MTRGALTIIMLTLTIIVPITPSWGQTYNPTASNATTHNTAGGLGAVQALNGALNTGFGYLALTSNSTGTSNTGMGADTLVNNTTGFSNTATGVAALISNVDGFYNTGTGKDSLRSNTSGNYNTATGESALYENTTGIWNTAEGVLALEQNVTGSFNTAVGAKALKKSTGTKNIGLGYQAGVTLTSGNNNIYIGNTGAGAESQTIRIGTAQTATFIAGINGGSVSGATVMVDGNGQLGILTSSARYKRDIMPMASKSEKVLDLRPVTFVYKDDATGATHYGLVAEEVAAVYPELVTHTAIGDVQTVKYHELIPMLLNELQRQRRELTELRGLLGARAGQSVGSKGIVADAGIAQGETGEALR